MNGDGQDLINSSKSGFCVNSGDIEGLANAIIKLRKSTVKERIKLGENAFNYYKLHFEREENLTRLIEFVFNDRRIIDTEYPD